MRLLLTHWGRRGGGPRFTYELARALARIPGVAVHLSLSRNSELHALTRSLGLPAHDIDTYDGPASFALGSLRLPSIARNLTGYLRRERIDVALSTMRHIWSPFVFGAIRAAGAKIASIVHDAEPHAGDRFPGWAWSLRRELAASDAVITLSQHVADALRVRHGAAPERIHCLVHPAFSFQSDPASPHALPTDRPPRLLFFGRMKPYKGLALFLEAACRIQTKRPIEVIVAGPGNLASYGAALGRIARLQLINRWIPETEVGAIFARADLVVASHVEASQSGVVPAAYAAGLPVVATPVGGLREQVKQGVTGLLAEAVSAQGLAAAIERLLADSALYAHCAKGAAAMGEGELSWERFAAAMFAILKSICAQPGAAGHPGRGLSTAAAASGP